MLDVDRLHGLVVCIMPFGGIVDVAVVDDARSLQGSSKGLGVNNSKLDVC